ncbi:leucine rich repeat (LRR) protein [Kordia periserrulae]|uniref:Leucine rich repeat (LRR) protein n=1 Tax=Kordia periserrulae TaxID=701523 RepID=A0A2T6C635_9FLAO|nr:leucine-rich repeat domain-containing protein [Kordia periserrulae]PTX63757.1 leucine rich repeat (LRR) protein [Kordia periserrulae]
MKLTNFSKILSIGFLSIIFITCGNLLSDEELQERYQKASESKNWKAAKDLIDEYLERKPEDIEAYFSRAKIATNVAPLDIKGIISDLNTYLEHVPESSLATLFRFQAYLYANEFEKAMADIDTIIERHGKNPFLLSWKGNCAFMSQKFDIAAKVYEQRTRMPGTYEDIRNNYYFMIFSKYLGNNKEGAVWDTAFLDNRGFQEDTLLMRNIIEDKITFEQVAKFELPKLTISEMDGILKNNCADFNMFDENKRFQIEILNSIARVPRTENLKALLPQRNELKIVNLRDSELHELPTTLFQFKNLEILDLSRNQFTDIEKTIQQLSLLPNLRILKLGQCGIRKLPENIALLDNLWMLSLQGNLLQELPNGIGELRQLKYLSLETNLKLTSLPVTFQNLQCLQYLEISQTRLKQFPAVVGYCSQLIKLSANRCKIETLPETLSYLVNLRSLSMHHNKIEKLPQTFGDLETLRSINLSTNKLKGLPKSFQKLQNLFDVSLDSNDFKMYPKELAKLKNLYSIDVHDTPISNIPTSIAKDSELKYLMVNPKYISQKNIDSLQTINPNLNVTPRK